jgi:hypothetical protein
MPPGTIETLRRVTGECIAQQRSQLGVRGPLCLAIAGGDPSQCIRVKPMLRPVCEVLSYWRSLIVWLARLRSFGAEDPLIVCPVEMPPGVEVNEAACRTIPLSQMILPGNGGRADLAIKALNPYEESALCKVTIKATWSGGERSQMLELALPARAALDRRVGIRYDAMTTVDMQMECSWPPL